jgi:predicted HicB family RNase H-like nuclease
MTENEIDLEALSTTEPGRIAPTAQQALARIEAAVDYHLREMDEVFGAEPRTPLTEQNYSGRFLVRTSRALHARLILEAAEQGVSLNQWVAQKLADRKPDLDW